jgi:hypothetical protein
MVHCSGGVQLQAIVSKLCVHSAVCSNNIAVIQSMCTCSEQYNSMHIVACHAHQKEHLLPLHNNSATESIANCYAL